MYISRIKLDLSNDRTVNAIENDRQLLHAAFESSVEGDRPHILWRIEPDMSILAVSKDIPYLGDVQQQFGDSRVKPVTKDYDAHLSSIKNGDVLRFRICVNPVIDKMSADKGHKSRRDVPLNLKKTEKYPDYSAEDWTIRRMEKKGAKILDIALARSKTYYFKKDERRIPLFTVTYEGVLMVADADLFREAIANGIGGKKTYGCGMLTVKRA